MSTESEIEQKAQELVNLTTEIKELQNKVKDLKEEIKAYLDINNINDWVAQVDNGYVELITGTTYKLCEIPANTQLPEEITEKIPEDAFRTKIVLSKKGKRLKEEHDSEIMKLMDAKITKKIKVEV